MEFVALGRKPVGGPSGFEMDQPPLPLAEQEVLQAGDGEEIGFVEHQFRSMERPGLGTPTAQLRFAIKLSRSEYELPRQRGWFTDLLQPKSSITVYGRGAFLQANCA